MSNLQEDRFYPPECLKVWVARVCPSGESQPRSPPPAAASPASSPGIHRLPSPRTHHPSETSQVNSVLVWEQKKSWKPLLKRGLWRALWEKKLQAEIKEHSFCPWMFCFCLQESDGTFCPPSLSTSTFCKAKSELLKKKTNDLPQGSVKKKRTGFATLGECDAFLD